MTHVARLSNSAAAADGGRRARVERRLGASPFLAAPLRRLGYDSRELWAWDNYQASVLGFVDHCRMTGRHEGGLVRVLEIGGGRDPLMRPREAADARIAYAVNDIDARELAMGPAEFERESIRRRRRRRPNAPRALRPRHLAHGDGARA